VPELCIPADGFKIGDLVHRTDGPPIEIRTIDRRDGGVLDVNDGQPDEMHGFAWQTATVTRPEGL
jgi:hypothetical protein